MNAPGTEEVGKILRGEGKFVVSVTEKSKADDSDDIYTMEQHTRRVRKDDVIYFAHQLSIMVETGVPLGQALESVAGPSARSGAALDQSPSMRTRAAQYGAS